VKTIEIYAPSKQPDVFIIMEVMSGGELFDRIVEKECYNEAEARKAFKDMLMAIKYLHEKGIVHRDLKPENLLYASKEDDAVLKLADFGLAHILKDNQLLSSACGTPGYVAPEVLAKKGYGKEVDMWGLGVILYILLSGCPPFYHEDHSELFQAIMTADYDFPSPDWDNISPEAVDLIKALMCLDPKQRITAEDALKHPFMVSELEGEHMAESCAKLKAFNARRRFKKGILAVQMVSMMKHAAFNSKAGKKSGLAGMLSQAQAAEKTAPTGESTAPTADTAESTAPTADTAESTAPTAETAEGAVATAN